MSADRDPRGAASDDPRVLDLASSVGDGTPVDWDAHAAQAGDQRERRLLDSLRILSEVARVHGGQLGQEELFGAVSPAPAGPLATPTDAVEALPLPSQWGPLTLIKALGHGGFGDVYLAHDPNLQRDVAVKFLRPAAGRGERATQQLLDEARRLARVRHNSIVHVYGAEEHSGRAGMWMELLHGETLSQTVERQGSFGEREALLVGLDLCRALAALHGAGLIHRDVKAHNVLRETGGRLVLMDLGAGAEAPIAPAGASTPQSNARARSVSPHVGTPVYAAPELLRGEPASPRSDLYALGVLLYHLVTCGYPVVAPTLAELRRAHEQGHRQPLRDLRPDVSAEFVRIVERLLDPDPARRYTSAGQLEAELQRALGVADAPAARPQRQRRTWALAAAALAIAVLAVGARIPQRAWNALTGAGPYTVQASLYREGGAVPERLRDGATVAEGDGLFLRMEASRPLHLYVLDIDAAGKAFLLFPLRDHVPANPLPAGRAHELPGVRSGASDVWVITDGAPGERENLLLVASPRPLRELDQLAAALPPTASGESLAYPPVDGGALRGISSVRRRAPSGLAAGEASDVLLRLLQEAGPLGDSPDHTREEWVRRVALRHGDHP